MQSYSGWQFAKLVLLTKIIGVELKAIQIWRYHPGLSTEFMLDLERKLSERFEDLAKSFQNHLFLEQEFWLTAFYLNPIEKYHIQVKKCAMRATRKRQVEEQHDNRSSGSNVDSSAGTEDKKFVLLSSTIDVKDIVSTSNYEDRKQDYEPLKVILRKLRLPESLIKDLLTVTFLPRNKSFAWVVNWNTLRQRCKALAQNEVFKKRLVEQNMAEANNKLKFLKIDYEKYKHRPQIDYGSIEEGYEHVVNLEEQEEESSDEDEYEQMEKKKRKEQKLKKPKWEIKEECKLQKLTKVVNQPIFSLKYSLIKLL